MKSLASILSLSFLLVHLGQAAPVTIKGKVTAFNAYPLSGVKISIKKGESTTTTNTAGEFEISLEKGSVLLFEAEGFNSTKRKIKKDSKELVVNLVFENTEDNIKKAVSNKYLSEEDLRYGLNHRIYDNIDYSMFTDVYAMVRSSFPGVTVTTENGQKIFEIRGSRSLMASNAALIVVDDVPLSGSNLNFLSPRDVKNIKVLKGPDATQYGSRGANGVVVIETRRAQ